MTKHLRYCGRDFTLEEFELIRRLIAEHPTMRRTPLSQQVCQILKWHRHDGQLKEMSCRVALVTHAKGWLNRTASFYTSSQRQTSPKTHA